MKRGRQHIKLSSWTIVRGSPNDPTFCFIKSPYLHNARFAWSSCAISRNSRIRISPLLIILPPLDLSPRWDSFRFPSRTNGISRSSPEIIQNPPPIPLEANDQPSHSRAFKSRRRKRLYPRQRQ